jgi:nucleoside-diphosphate-sugar epimerase
MTTRCLITGGAGFIGSHLAQAVHARGAEIVLLDDLSTGNADNLAPLLGCSGVSFVHGSILDEALVARHAEGCDVSDAVGAAVGLMEDPRAVGDVFNVGGSEPIAIRDLALKVKALAGSPSKVVFIPYEQAYGPGFEDIQRRVPDTTKLERLLNFRPTKTLDGIVQEVIRAHRKSRRAAETSLGGVRHA